MKKIIILISVMTIVELLFGENIIVVRNGTTPEQFKQVIP